MKRELIGLVLGTMLLMAGLAFLFSQNITASTSLEAKQDTEQPRLAQAALSAVPARQAVPALTVTPATVVDPVVRDTPALPETSTEVTPSATAALLPAAVPAAAPVLEQPAPVENAPAATSPATVELPEVASQPEVPSKAVATGWIYAGQFVNGKWTEQGIKSGSVLPMSGQRYTLTWAATVRDNPPGKKVAGSKLGKVIANLAAGKEVEVVQVKQSGRQGHVWLEIKQEK
ncbi:MAG: hypothetical protein ACK4RS_05510 [Thiothrix sp.]